MVRQTIRRILRDGLDSYGSTTMVCLVALGIRQQVLRICGFIHHCLEVHKLKASTINGCLSGIAFHLRSSLMSTDAFSHPSVGACKSAAALLERIRAEPILTARKLPFTVSMLKDLVAHETANGSMAGKMIAVEAQLGVFVCSDPQSQSEIAAAARGRR